MINKLQLTIKKKLQIANNNISDFALRHRWRPTGGPQGGLDGRETDGDADATLPAAVQPRQRHGLPPRHRHTVPRSYMFHHSTFLHAILFIILFILSVFFVFMFYFVKLVKCCA